MLESREYFTESMNGTDEHQSVKLECYSYDLLFCL